MDLIKTEEDKWLSDTFGHNTTEFNENALKAVGLSGHPRSREALAFAWKGSATFSEVFFRLETIAEIYLMGEDE
jgi:hypothetical protein